ncbi:rRNA maturation RNase YbeY [Mesomycoplasma lagogenitalium]|uniref:Endoribonuclease YbeY n=1 Tax=Mesomycoplasma lagogenitalium TaxID=171286 RepID=A0ABY8LUU8_9BACT|nr:rRNA maturation RNase YbeY [Mesomycoplasma lagogenitalium]WGI37011.1 rRNA maturation RNase YbeY [Mesomycoplasma lagogenitalium]
MYENKKNILNFCNETHYKFRFLKEFKEILNLAQKEFNIKKNISVDLLLTDNENIKQISNTYRNKNKPTDILSFPTDWNQLNFLDILPIGEIIISYEKVKEQAKEYGHSIKREYCYLFAHGIAHLFGFDHLTKEEEDKMNYYVDNIMKKMEINR